MKCEINLLNRKFNRRRQFFNCLSKFSCKREARKKIDDYTFQIAFIVENIYNFLGDESSSSKKEIRRRNAHTHPTRCLYFFMRCALFDVFKKENEPFASGEVDLGDSMFTFSFHTYTSSPHMHGSIVD